MRLRKIFVFSGFVVEETLIPLKAINEACTSLKSYLAYHWNKTKATPFDSKSWSSDFIDGPFFCHEPHEPSGCLPILYLVDLITNGSTLVVDFDDENKTGWPIYLRDMDTKKLTKEMSLIVGLSVARCAYTLPGDTKDFIEKLDSDYRSWFGDDGGDGDDGTEGESGSNHGDDGGDGDDGTKGESGSKHGDDGGTGESEHGNEFDAPLLKMEYEKLITDPFTLGTAIKNKVGGSSKKKTENICWLISIFQALSHLPHFVRVLAESGQVRRALGLGNGTLLNLIAHDTEIPKEATLVLLLLHHACWAHLHDKGVMNFQELHDRFYKTLAERALSDNFFERFSKPKGGDRLKRNKHNEVEAGFKCLIRLLEAAGLSDFTDVFSFRFNRYEYCEVCKHYEEYIDPSARENIFWSIGGKLEDECFEKLFYPSLFSSGDNDINNLVTCKSCDTERAMRKSVCKTSDVSPKIMALMFGKDEVSGREKNKQSACYPYMCFAKNFFCIPTSHSLQTFDIYQTLTAIDGIGGHYVTDIYNDTGSQVCHYDDSSTPIVQVLEPSAPLGYFNRAFIFAKLLDEAEITNTHRDFIGMSLATTLFPYLPNQILVYFLSFSSPRLLPAI